MSDDANSHKQSKPLFDPTINYGHVLTALSIIIAGTGAYYGMSVELHNVDQRVAKIEATLQQLANVVVMTARQDESDLAHLDRTTRGSWSSHQATGDMGSITKSQRGRINLSALRVLWELRYWIIEHRQSERGPLLPLPPARRS